MAALEEPVTVEEFIPPWSLPVAPLWSMPTQQKRAWSSKTRQMANYGRLRGVSIHPEK
jgi:hypothetical protein